MEEVSSLEKILIPYGKEVEFQNISYENGFRMIRLRIREGKRFTMIDLDEATVNKWLEVFSHWQQNQDATD